jgi:hypothetical protein
MKRACWFCAFCGCFCLISTFVLSQGFQAAVTYASGAGYGYAVAIADVNGDGIPDVIVANSGGGNGNDGSVAVLLGNGNGTFQPAVSYDTGGEDTVSVVAADLRRDGKIDLVVANNTSRTVGVLLGNGNGTFQPAVTYGLGKFAGGPMNAVVADVNGDGIPDLVVDDAVGGRISVLIGKGNGAFKTAHYFKGGANWVTTADLTGNGSQDLIVAAGYFIYVLLNKGDGKFEKLKKIENGNGTVGYVAAVDVNGDGIPDLLAVMSNCPSGGTCLEGGVGVLLGNGDGTFGPMVAYGTGAYSATSVVVADVNGDGIPDLVVSNFCAPTECSSPGAGTVSVLLGNGNGTFQTASTYGSGGYWGAFSVGVGDLTGNGGLDLVIANFEGYGEAGSYGSSVGVLLSNY